MKTLINKNKKDVSISKSILTLWTLPSVGICAMNTALCPELSLRLSTITSTFWEFSGCSGSQGDLHWATQDCLPQVLSFQGHGAQSVSSGPGKIRTASVCVSAWQPVPECSVRWVGVTTQPHQGLVSLRPVAFLIIFPWECRHRFPHTTLYLCFLEIQVKIFCTRSGPGTKTLWCHLQDFTYQSSDKDNLKTGGRWAEGTPWCVKSQSISWSCFLENTNKI